MGGAEGRQHLTWICENHPYPVIDKIYNKISLAIMSNFDHHWLSSLLNPEA